jgi:hypothetical protein
MYLYASMCMLSVVNWDRKELTVTVYRPISLMINF